MEPSKKPLRPRQLSWIWPILSYQDMLKFSDIKPSGCIEWTARLQAGGGYGIVNWEGQAVYAHILSWYFVHGVWPPEGMEVCHSCDNPPCFNPIHLLLGTRAANIIDAMLKGRHTGRPHKHGKDVRDAVMNVLIEGTLSQRKIAKQFNISQATVSEIYRGVHEPRR